jgi:hypothetical protein
MLQFEAAWALTISVDQSHQGCAIAKTQSRRWSNSCTVRVETSGNKLSGALETLLEKVSPFGTVSCVSRGSSRECRVERCLISWFLFFDSLIHSCTTSLTSCHHRVKNMNEPSLHHYTNVTWTVSNLCRGKPVPRLDEKSSSSHWCILDIANEDPSTYK